MSTLAARRRGVAGAAVVSVATVRSVLWPRVAVSALADISAYSHRTPIIHPGVYRWW